MAEKPRDAAGPDSRPRELEVTCPSCQTQLQVDARTGVVLHGDRPRKNRASFEDALAAERRRQDESDALFGKALSSERNHRALLQRKFEKALEKAAEEPDERPPHPLDGD